MGQEENATKVVRGWKCLNRMFALLELFLFLGKLVSSELRECALGFWDLCD